MVADAVQPLAKPTERTVSSIPRQIRVGRNEPSSTSLQRKPSVRTYVDTSTRLSTTVTHQEPKSHTEAQYGGGTLPKPGSKPLPRLRQPAHRPQFNAYQQHFSPRKPTRPSSVVSDTPCSNENASKSDDTPETARLRDELLQLQLIHVDSHDVLQRYKNSSYTKLKNEYAALKEMNTSLLAQEQYRERCANYMALHEWLDSDMNNNEKLQLLARCVRDIDSLTAKDGTYSKAIAQFETWYEGMIVARENQKKQPITIHDSLLFVEPIDTLWLQAAATIQRKLRITIQELRDLGEANGKGVHFILASYKRLATTMYQELETCSSIQTIVQEQEDEWVAQSVDDLLSADMSSQQKRPPTARRGAWEECIST